MHIGSKTPKIGFSLLNFQQRYNNSRIFLEHIFELSGNQATQKVNKIGGLDIFFLIFFLFNFSHFLLTFLLLTSNCFFIFFYSIHLARLIFSGNKKELSQEKIRQIILYAFFNVNFFIIINIIFQKYFLEIFLISSLNVIF